MLHNIYVTSKMLEKVITNLDLSKASGPDSILVVVLKNCETTSSTLQFVSERALFSRLLESLIGGSCV